jgi:tRNA(Ile)-lysidine synthase
MHPKLPKTLAIDTTLLKPGLRLAVGLSGGADSVALTCALAEQSKQLGLVLHAAHLHHGLRGEEADGDLAFSRDLAAELGLPFHEARVETEREARADATSGKAAETIEEAARRLRYGWFRQLIASGKVDAVVTAHTLDDQAETVLAKFLRGAWTEGLSGIHPVIEFPEGRILRPLLGTTRTEIEAYLGALGQGWREDSSNRHLSFTRNRIRHELLPLLEGWNPRLREHLAQMAELARTEEAWWADEVARIAPQLLLRGRPVRGGGRAAGDGLAIDVTRLAALPLALQRRLLRHAAEQLGTAVDFPATEAMRLLASSGRAGQKLELAEGLRAERTPRELRLEVSLVGETKGEVVLEYKVAIPGEVTAEAFGLRLRIEVDSSPTLGDENGSRGDNVSMGEVPSGAKAHLDLTPDAARLKSCPVTKLTVPVSSPSRVATLRNWRPGDRVTLRYSSGPRKAKEVLERLKVTGSERRLWPVLEIGGRIVWMKGVELEPTPGVCVAATILADSELSSNGAKGDG